jgi:hypothetical protein
MIVRAKPLTLFLIAVAAVVTPLGLYEIVEASEALKPAVFSYIHDSGPTELGTPIRTDLGFSRTCDRVCPGSGSFFEFSYDKTWVNVTKDGLDHWIPQKLAELYQSGLASQSPTVSSFFDIQARLFSISADESYSNLTYLVDRYRSLGTFILDDKMQAVEGLVVDTQRPKIGFRNHTAPTNAQYGAEWEEELLFLEPETKFIDVNISLQIKIPENRDLLDFLAQTTHLIDRGGFANMNITTPWSRMKGEYIWYDGTQEDASLGWRAEATGWTTNVLLAYFFNVTAVRKREAYMDSKVGKLFSVNTSYSSTSVNQITLTSDSSNLASRSIPGAWENGTFVSSDLIGQEFWPNPWRISQQNFTQLNEQCEGVGITLGGKANMTNIQVKCGLVVGTAHPTRGEKTLVPQPGTIWEHPIYSCASATKASIKTARFRYNSTSNNFEPFRRLEVLSIADKVYNSLDAMPLWGIEDANMSVRNVDPLWGLIDPSWENSVNLSTVRAEHLYLPAGQASIDTYPLAQGSDFIPAATGPGKAWQRLYSSFGDVDGVDNSGAGNLALYKKWDDVSHTAEGAANILNLLFIDYAANSLVGTKGQLTTSTLPPNLQKRSMSTQKRDDGMQHAEVLVHLSRRTIRYQWIYGVPALLSLFVVALILVGATVALLTGRGSIKRVKHYVWNLSAGRILTNLIYPGSSPMYSDTKEWIRAVGAKQIMILPDDLSVAGADEGARPATASARYQAVAQDEPTEIVVDGVKESPSVSSGLKSPTASKVDSAASSDSSAPR